MIQKKTYNLKHNKGAPLTPHTHTVTTMSATEWLNAASYHFIATMKTTARFYKNKIKTSWDYTIIITKAVIVDSWFFALLLFKWN